jgi:S1-C subfamily serine protease
LKKTRPPRVDPTMGIVALLVALAMVGTGVAAAPATIGAATARRALEVASVELLKPGCTGVLTESPEVVVTALHCIPEGAGSVEVRFAPGWTRRARVVAVDRTADQAALVLDDPVPIEPLQLVRRQQIPGTVLYFEGHPARPRFQETRLERVGRCPGLPGLPNALFTGIRGRPGDSGAPVVDAAGDVVGIVHGGARCHILTPASTLRRLIRRVYEGRWPRVAQARRATASTMPSRRIFA